MSPKFLNLCETVPHPIVWLLNRSVTFPRLFLKLCSTAYDNSLTYAWSSPLVGSYPNLDVNKTAVFVIWLNGFCDACERSSFASGIIWLLWQVLLRDFLWIMLLLQCFYFFYFLFICFEWTSLIQNRWKKNNRQLK